MASSQRHIIDRLQVELQVSTPNRANELQEQVSSILRKNLEPVLEKLFDRMPEDKTVVIDRLELDLGVFSGTELGHTFIQELRNKIEKELPELTRSVPPQGEGIQQYSKSELYFQTFSHYLQTGTYPWFVSQHPDDAILHDPNKLYRALVSQDDLSVFNLIEDQSGDPDFRKRLIYLLADDQFKALADKLETPDKSRDYGSIRDVFSGLGTDQDKLETAIKSVRLASSSGITSSNQLLNIFLRTFAEDGVLEQLWSRLSQSVGEIQKLDDGVLTTPLKEIAVLFRLQQELDRDFQSADQFDEVMEKVPRIGDAEEYLKKLRDVGYESDKLKRIQKEIEKRIDARINPVFRSTKPDSQKKEEREKGFYVTNAGLILLWPFLPKFFRKLELTADRQFIDKRSQFKAIHVLQYLATGEQSTFEYVMVLNKILCGYPVERPFPSEIEFSENELEEADLLIESTIEQWEALKNTSVEGLRHSFLQRNARLKERSKQWELQVESKGFDVLLDKLPWGISVARLPWMNKPIYVDWR